MSELEEENSLGLNLIYLEQGDRFDFGGRKGGGGGGVGGYGLDVSTKRDI